jgi:hypothetical protein
MVESRFDFRGPTLTFTMRAAHEYKIETRFGDGVISIAPKAHPRAAAARGGLPTEFNVLGRRVDGKARLRVYRLPTVPSP